MTALVGALTLAVPAHAQSDAQWTEWGARVHGGFGSLIAYGVVIGQDALQRLHAQRRELSVHYVDGPQTPCACVLDGVSVAVSASLGQRTLVLDEQRAEPGVLARIRFTRRDNGATVEYELPQAMLARMADHHEQQLDEHVSRLATLLEPAIMLVLGVMLGTLVMAMYWPIFQLGQVL